MLAQHVPQEVVRRVGGRRVIIDNFAGFPPCKERHPVLALGRVAILRHVVVLVALVTHLLPAIQSKGRGGKGGGREVASPRGNASHRMITA